MQHRKIQIILRQSKSSASYKAGSERVLEHMQRTMLGRIALVLARLWPSRFGFVPMDQFLDE